MCFPMAGDVKKFSLLGRYLMIITKTMLKYAVQTEQEDLHIFFDSDFMGCKRTAKSTSGCVMMLGEHYINS